MLSSREKLFLLHPVYMLVTMVASFHMVHVYTINWFKKVQNINYCSHAAQPTFNCHKRGGGGIMAQLFILSYSNAVSFRDIRGHLG